MTAGTPDQERTIFLDHHSTTPVDPRVVDAMLPHFSTFFANPHSVEHGPGLRAARVIENAKARVASLIGAAPGHLVFTSGATESNNLALRGIVANRKKAHVISSVIEHSSITATLRVLEHEGHRVTRVGVDHEGRINSEDIIAALTPATSLVSIQAANGEIGAIQAISEIGRACRERGVLFHTDAVQAYGHVSLDVVRDCIDMMSLSAHKLYGPKGIGALYVSDAARTQLRPQITGGEQQDGLRAGTLPTPLVVGFARAVELFQQEGATSDKQIAQLRDDLLSRLTQEVAGVHLNGPRTDRLPGNLNICIDGIDADSLLLALPDIALSTGSACTAGALDVSPVLLALGLPRAMAETAVRIGLGRDTTQVEIEHAVARISQVVATLRS
jgi:cysteine desulfurase